MYNLKTLTHTFEYKNIQMEFNKYSYLLCVHKRNYQVDRVNGIVFYICFCQIKVIIPCKCIPK